MGVPGLYPAGGYGYPYVADRVRAQWMKHGGLRASAYSSRLFSEVMTVRPGQPDDINYLLELHRRNRGALGFLPRQAFEEYLTGERGKGARASIVTENDDSAGYLLADLRQHGGQRHLRIVHSCIQLDARRRHLGVSLVNTMLADNRPDSVRLRCAGDLLANQFWSDMGFTCVAADYNRSGRAINTWMLTPGPTLFDPSPVPPITHERMERRKVDDTGYF